MTSRFAPTVEPLEAREVPAVHLSVAGHTLSIIGDGKPDTVTVRDNGQGTLTVTADGQHLTASSITRVVIRTGGGDDTVDYKLTGKLKVVEDVFVNLGAGADKAALDFSAGVAAGGHLTVDVHDGGGKDADVVKTGDVAKGGSEVVHQFGGKGRDATYFHATGIVGGRLVDTMSGGAGHDTDHISVGVRLTGTGSVHVSGK